MITALLICLAPVAIDGDTLHCGTSQEIIRIWGVNAPEKKSPGAAESTINLQRLANGGLVCEPKGASYNRVVAQCFNGANLDVSRLQLEGGFAVEWCGYSKGFYGTCPKK